MIKLIKEHITNKMDEYRNRGIIKVAQQMKSNVSNVGKIWEIKQKVQRKSQALYTIKMKKQQNRMFIPNVRRTQEILWKPTENKTFRDSWRNTDTV